MRIIAIVLTAMFLSIGVQSPALAQRIPVNDYDGDGISDPAVWRNTDAYFYMRPSSRIACSSIGWEQWGPGCRRQFGLPGDWPVTGVFDGFRRTNRAVFRPQPSAVRLNNCSLRVTPAWFLQSSMSSVWNLCGLPYFRFPEATSPDPLLRQTDYPCPIDFDGDGATDIAWWNTQYRTLTVRPGLGQWAGQLLSVTNQLPGVDDGTIRNPHRSPLSSLGIAPALNCDFNGDAAKEFVFLVRPPQESRYQGLWVAGGRRWASAPAPYELPVCLDLNKDARSEFIRFNRATGVWTISINLGGPFGTPTATEVSVQWGLPGDLPVLGDYNGDGADDLVVYRHRDGNWYILTYIAELGMGSTMPPPGSQPFFKTGGWVIQWGLPQSPDYPPGTNMMETQQVPQ